jgi:hypothetical protein
VKFFEGITSYNNATVGSGSVLNDDELTYNAFGQLASDQQSHNGAVNTSTSPQTQYAYDDGSSNEIRPASVTYPNGRVIDYVYNGDTTSDKLNRVTSIFDASAGTDGSTVASYAYQGLNHVQTETYPTPKVKLDYTGTSSDTFTGWDNFDRVACQDWINYNATAFDVFKISHGYDQACLCQEPSSGRFFQSLHLRHAQSPATKPGRRSGQLQCQHRSGRGPIRDRLYPGHSGQPGRSRGFRGQSRRHGFV